ncbi:MAG TPA: SDR family oxidoreductase [Thermoleophilia bacterium]|nr:SDR family oxidoreductase [Thermoleophilia bacterium]
MKLAIFGATGGTGRQLVAQALARGDELTVLARDPAKLARSDPRLHVVTGDVHDAEVVGETVAGADAVLSALGHRRGSGRHVLTTGAQLIVAAMNEAGVRRLVVLSITAVRDPHDRPRTIERLMEGVGHVLAGGVYADHLGQATVVQAADLDWTIVRAPLLTNGPHTGHYHVGSLGGGMGGRISRADVADFMLKQAADATHVRQVPLVGS